MAHGSEHLSEHIIMLFIFSVLEFAKSHNLNVHKYDRARKSGAKFSLLSYIFLVMTLGVIAQFLDLSY